MGSAGLELGVLLHTRHLIREAGATDFSSLWDEAILADELGADHVWLGDSVTLLEKARGDCLTTMAALAALTKRVRIGVVPFLVALRNPVLLAHTLATLDVIAQGRIMIGASVGSVKQDMNQQFDACGVAHREKAGRLNECIEMMRRLWTERVVTFEGKYYQIREIGILPHPIRKPTIPIWFATGRNEKALERAGRLGDGWITNTANLEDFTKFRRMVDDFARLYRREGQAAASALYASFHLNANGERARRDGWSWMEDFFRQPRARLTQHLAIFGTPDECAQTLRSYMKAGLTAVIARLASEDQRTQMRLYLKELKPRLGR